MLDLVDYIKRCMKYRAKTLEPESMEFYFSEVENKLVMSLIEGGRVRSVKSYQIGELEHRFGKGVRLVFNCQT